MFEHLQIYEPRERWAVGLADAALQIVTRPAGWRRPPATDEAPRRALVLRLERIGDLLMTFEALSLLRALLPTSEIDLCVGSWNAELARAMAVADNIDVVDAPWLARDQPGARWPHLIGHAREWRARRYGLAINFEPDIRSNLLLRLAGAPRRIGYYTGGGGALLTEAAAYDTSLHTRDNAVRLAGLAAPAVGPLPGAAPRLQLPDLARERARQLLAPAAGSLLIGVHASGGRPVKQWHAERFAEVATALAREYRATIVLTGASADAPLISQVRAAIPSSVRALSFHGQADLLDLAAVIERLAVFITGDTGPMHLAAAVGTPVVAVFGPSDPARYAPGGPRNRVVRIDLPCSPCNRIRLPPARCRGHVPDCLDGVSTGRVLSAVRECLSAEAAPDPRAGRFRS